MEEPEEIWKIADFKFEVWTGDRWPGSSPKFAVKVIWPDEDVSWLRDTTTDLPSARKRILEFCQKEI